MLSVQVIFLFQSMFTFLVPSGSGQAALTVPIVAPLSDLLDVGRQTAIIVFQLGDGLFSMLVPISGVTMGYSPFPRFHIQFGSSGLLNSC